MVKSHHIRYLSRFEFLEAIIRIAVAKYGLNDAGETRAVSSAVDTLIEANIKQYYKDLEFIQKNEEVCEISLEKQKFFYKIQKVYEITLFLL